MTIACGACSGFHGLVCSGTTSKQIDKESHCHPVGYGAMLLEGFVAVIALATVMIATQGELAGKAPGAVYGAGLGRFLVTIIGEEHLLFATTFGAMAFSTFVFDTLDVSTRLGRYILQELTGTKGRGGGGAWPRRSPAGCRWLFVLMAGSGAWRSFWTLFGTSNQLLAVAVAAGHLRVAEEERQALCVRAAAHALRGGGDAGRAWCCRSARPSSCRAPRRWCR